MFNEYDMNNIHDQPFPRIGTESTTTPQPAKMNIIVPIIPEPARNIMDFIFLLAGISLNTFLGLVIVLNPRMYTSVNCYVISLIFSNMLILVEPCKQVVQWNFDIIFRAHADYMFLVSFSTSILTIILLNIETYVVVCRKNSPLHKRLQKITMAVKCILYIWTICIIVTALELDLYVHFEEDIVDHIYVVSTVMFLIFPCFIFIMLDSFILYDLIISKLIDGTWPTGDIERFIFLIGITGGYFVTMIPYRVARAIALVTDSCCSDTAIEVLYTILKMYPMILPVTCFVTSREFRQAVQKTLTYRRDEVAIIT